MSHVDWGYFECEWSANQYSVLTAFDCGLSPLLFERTCVRRNRLRLIPAKPSADEKIINDLLNTGVLTAFDSLTLTPSGLHFVRRNRLRLIPAKPSADNLQYGNK
jgi:hypothetical protein